MKIIKNLPEEQQAHDDVEIPDHFLPPYQFHRVFVPALLVPGIVQASHALVLLQKHKDQLETAYANIKAHKREIATLEAMVDDYGCRIADLTHSNCEMKVREREASLEMLTLKKETLHSQNHLSTTQEQLDASKKQAEEMQKEMRAWKAKHNEITFWQTERDAAHKATAHATFSKYGEEWFTEKKKIPEREEVAKVAAESFEAQFYQLRQLRREDWKCNSCDKTDGDGGDWVKATEKLRENYERETELLQKRIASLESDQDIAIEAHPLHQQIKAALLAKFKETFTMQQQAKTIKTQMERLSQIHQRTKEEWETKMKALEEELKATKLQHKEENEEPPAHREETCGNDQDGEAVASDYKAPMNGEEDFDETMESWRLL